MLINYSIIKFTLTDFQSIFTPLGRLMLWLLNWYNLVPLVTAIALSKWHLSFVVHFHFSILNLSYLLPTQELPEFFLVLQHLGLLNILPLKT